jgi:hypothetical protein
MRRSGRIRERLRVRGLRLLLDLVPNHTGLDHPWVEEHPEYYVQGTDADLAIAPQNYTRVKRMRGDCVLAHGRDPYFPEWPDTLQLNYGNRATQDAMIAELVKIAGQCDGVRCDMAMLVLPDVFERTWSIHAPPFWPDATRRVRERAPGFTFMAEVYWDLEWTLQQQGFDYTYDKRLYDRLRDGHAPPYANTFTPASITRTSSPASSRTTTSPERPRRSRRTCTRRRPSLRSCRRASLLPSGTVRGTTETHLAASGSRPGRGSRPAAAALLRSPARRAATAGRPRRPVAAARMRTGLGGKLDLGLLRGLCLAGCT